MIRSASEIHRKIQASLAVGELDKAACLCADELKIRPENSQVWVAFSEICLRTNNSIMAINAALKAILYEPYNVRYVFHLAGCYLHQQALSAAIKALDHADTLLKDNASSELWDKLGELRYRANQLEEAMVAHRQALKIEPNSKRSRNQLAALLRFKGNLEQAEKLYNEVIELDPANYQACYNLSQLKRFEQPQILVEKIQKCQQLLDSEHKGHIMLHYSLGKVFEDSGNYDKAFEKFSQGAQLKREQHPYEIGRDLTMMSAVVDFVDQIDSSKSLHPKDHNQKPIFIVGLPRTGTTLVERILASHPSIVSGGELNSLPMALLEAGGKPIAAGLEGINDGLIKQLTPEKLQWLGTRYLQLSNNYVNHADIFVDKLPYNFLYCGFILHALPQAKVVHVKRNPFDAAVSNFKMLFNRGYEYSYRLEDVGHFIAAYEKLMAEWKQRFPGRIHTVEYEQLVNDQHQQTQMLLDYCQLPWDDACIHFYQNKDETRTASASQVREPIYSRSVDLWRQYQHHLTPLMDTFAEYGIVPTSFREN